MYLKLNQPQTLISRTELNVGIQAGLPEIGKRES